MSVTNPRISACQFVTIQGRSIIALHRPGLPPAAQRHTAENIKLAMKKTKQTLGAPVHSPVDEHSHINDPKLSDCGARRAGCMVAARRRREAASVARRAVRCSAWLN
jgi:hypothetical protein